MEKTYYPKASELSKDWFMADANGQNLGRFATKIAHILIGKHKTDFTPGVDNGDYVVIVNCERIVVTGKKMDDKMYYSQKHKEPGVRIIMRSRRNDPI